MLRSTTDRANIEQSASGERRQKFDCRFYQVASEKFYTVYFSSKKIIMAGGFLSLISSWLTCDHHI